MVGKQLIEYIIQQIGVATDKYFTRKTGEEITDLKNNQLLDTKQGTIIDITDSADMKLEKLDINGNSKQDTNKMTYTCDGTETGNYYFVYNNVNYQFTMPTIAEGNVLVFDTEELELSLNDTVITTTDASTGTLLTLSASPNPDYPQEVISAGENGSINATVTNKNLFDIDSTWNIKGSIGVGGDNLGKFPVNTGGNKRTYFFIAKPNTQYVISTKNKGDRLVIYEHYSIIDPTEYTTQNKLALDYSTVRITNPDLIPNEYTFTTSQNTKMIVVYYSSDSIPTDLMIEEGSTATPYTPHAHQAYTIPVQQPMRKIGDYADTFVKENGVWYEKHVIGETALSQANWRLAAQNESNAVFANTLDQDFCNYKSDELPFNSEYFIWKGRVQGYNAALTRGMGLYSYFTSIKNLYFVVPLAIANSLASFINWVTSNNITVGYIAETPTLLPCTQEQITVLEQIEKARSYLGTTHIYSTDEISPIFDVDYYKSTSLVINDIITRLEELEGGE